MSQRVLVVGGAGFIGSHMVKLLQSQGHEVTVYDCLDRGNRDAVPADILVEGNLLDRERLSAVVKDSKVDTVMHFAALAYVGESVHEPSTYYRNNVTGTQNLLDAMREHDVKRFVFSSTCATYGTPESLPITEATPQNPINPYGYTKLVVEHMLRDYATAYGLRSIALRYFNAAGCAADGSLGERHDPETHLLPLVLFEALRVKNGGDKADTTLKVFGDDFPTRGGTCVRDYVHVEDLCSAHTKAMHRMIETPDAGAEQFNLATNNGFTVLEVIEAAREITGIDFGYEKIGRRAGDPAELVANASLVMQQLGWQPQYPDIKDSIQHAWNWYLKHPPAK